jgi:predicted O-linked N-acetylglucosamine transferase (SPINDLY family)
MPTVSQALSIALIHHRDGRLDLAEEICRRILSVEPEQPDALHLLGAFAQELGDYARAVQYVERAIGADGNQAHFYNTLGEAYRCLERIPEAIQCYQRVIHMRPDYAEAYNNLGLTLEAIGRIEEAQTCYLQALQRQPDMAEAHNNLGNVFEGQGAIDEALASYRWALRYRPTFETAHTNLLCALRYHPEISPETLRSAFNEYDLWHAATWRAAWRPHLVPRTVDRQLRLGFVSPAFCRGPVGSFLIRALENLDRKQFHLTCYAIGPKRDRITDRFRQSSDTWRDCPTAGAGELAEQIRADQIDIVFDLAGIAPKNRLLAFARRPAPIQITWIDSVGSSGLSAMDHLLADRWLIPADAEAHYAERILRMPDGYVCYEPPAEAPPVGPLPATERGGVTFGSFNRPAKIHAGVIGVWAQILQRMPHSRLVLKHRGFDCTATQRRFGERFAAAGIAPARVEYLGFTAPEQYFAAYQQIDVMLDPFPHGGGLTSCDALWMGVPLVTCPGETFAGRQSLSHLSNIGLTALVARDHEEYVEMAVALATDLPRLAEIRTGLRERVANSPLCDGPRFARQLGDLLHHVWGEWVKQEQSVRATTTIEASPPPMTAGRKQGTTTR